MMKKMKYDRQWNILLINLFLIFFINGVTCENQSFNGSCVLPEHPMNGQWLVNELVKSNAKSNEEVPSGTTISIACDYQYTLNGSSIITCKNGKWISKIGECLKLCPPITTTLSTAVNCTNEEKTLDDCTKSARGTVATFRCNTYYENPELDINPFRICQNGSWEEEIPTCKPTCGMKIPSSSNETQHYYPWNIAIFLTREKDNKTYFRCGGTLINEKVIITNANCLTDDYDKTMPINSYTVVAGKTSVIFKDNDDTEAQYSAVENVYIPAEYKGALTKYADNIAVIVTKNAFKMNKWVQPVCVDWDNKFSEEFEYPKIKGFIPGPLKHPFFKELKQVFEIELSVVNETRCQEMLASEEGMRGNFQAYFTYDKICADYITEDMSPKCRVDTGVGLVAKTPYSDKYYLAGVVSSMNSVFYHKPRCDNQRWVLFTQVSKFLNFIRETH